MSKILNFLKYNNATVLIIAFIFLAASGVFAQTETGQAVIGEQQTRVEGTDNTLLLTADLDVFAMDFKIEKIEEEDDYYYVTYTFINLAPVNSAWEYQLQEKLKKVSKKSGVDLGKFLAEEFSEEYLARIAELRTEQEEARAIGEEKRVEVTAYTGLIGQTLDLVNKAFPAYESVVRTELPSPEFFIPAQPVNTEAPASAPDNLTAVYNQYMAENDPDADNLFGSLDNCPDIANPDQLDSDNDGIGDACDSETAPLIEGDDGELEIAPTGTDEVLPVTEETVPVAGDETMPAENTASVEIIELPAATPAAEAPTTE